jgi:hypothetical protein
MSVIEISIVNDLPADLHVPRHVLPFLLSRLLEHDEALLHAERRRDAASSVTWFVRQRSEGKEGDDRPIAQLPAGIFSSLITRIALPADVDYQRGGAGSMTLTQNGQRFECRVFLSRNRESGYWIRIYSRRIPPSM